MTTKHSLEISGISVEVVRKKIKNFHLAVYPPDGRVRVAAPLHLNDDAIRLAVISRLGWIRKQQQQFEMQERQSQREMVSGESHYFFGKRYRLSVIVDQGPAKISLLNNTMMELRVRPGTNQAQRQELIYRWYRQQLRERIPALITKWEPKLGVNVNEWGIKRMKTRWGSCNIGAKRIWLNLELAKKPILCLEYVLVHEMIHLLERHHNERFKGFMDLHMPQWHLYRDELNAAPLAYENWDY